MASANSVPVQGPSELDETWAEVLTPKRAEFSSALWMVVTFVLFLALSYQSFEPIMAVLLTGVLLFHELGHLAVMRLFGYRDLRVFFIPFLGAVAAGRGRARSAWQQGLVTLAGPVPGMVVAWVLILISPASLKASNELRILVFLLLTINSFNLLPLLPLDGGRILSQVLFARRPILELVFGVLTGGVLVLLAVAGRSWWLGLVGGLVILNSRRGHRLSHAAQGLRGTLGAGVGELADLTLEQRKALFETTRATLLPVLERYERGGHLTTEKRRTILASNMRAVFDRATTAPAGILATLCLLGLYLAACALALPIFRG